MGNEGFSCTLENSNPPILPVKTISQYVVTVDSNQILADQNSFLVLNMKGKKFPQTEDVEEEVGKGKGWRNSTLFELIWQEDDGTGGIEVACSYFICENNSTQGLSPASLKHCISNVRYGVPAALLREMQRTSRIGDELLRGACISKENILWLIVSNVLTGNYRS